MDAVSGATLWNSLPLTGVSDPTLTLTQFGAPLKTVLFSRAYETLTQHLCDSLGCKDSHANTNLLTYFLTSSSSLLQDTTHMMFSASKLTCFSIHFLLIHFHVATVLNIVYFTALSVTLIKYNAM